MKLEKIINKEEKSFGLEGVLNNGGLGIKSLFLSSPYPGNQKFGGQPTGLLYSLSVLANRKVDEYKSKELVKDYIKVWCPDGIEKFEGSSFEKELKNYLKKEKPKIIGLSTFSVSYQNALKIKDLAKETLPEVVIIFGGAHEDNSVKYYRKENKVDADFVVAGDGAYILDEIYKVVEEDPNNSVEKIKEKIEKDKNFENLPGAGIVLYNKNGKLNEINYSTKKNPMTLEEIPIMPRYLLRDEDALSRSFGVFGDKKTAQMIIGQGCPFGCSFCSEGIKKIWYDDDSPRSIEPVRNLKNVEEELDELKRNGYESLFFDDSTFFAKNKDYMRNLVKLLKEKNFEWGCQTTQNSIHKMGELLPEMKNSGLNYIYIGVEHYDGQMRDSFGKSIGGGNKFNGYSIEDTLELLKNNEIRTGLSLTFGHPDPGSKIEETKESKITSSYSINRTAELIKKFPNIEGVSLNLITYHPGTPNSERYEKKVGSIDYTGHPNKSEPFTKFEEGIGPHPYGMTKELASHILSYAKQKIPKEKLWI